ncbi:Plasmodium exported protein, unknown function [Plasmodium vivax]|uniref:Uncharacterized protein n=2 Tax=Plasmodium vivax TaxID=5855 RepID=A0A1G4GR36_PLAVI|nr:hypothetical protein PVBG_03297 [Plasmodium vivax Brazil I]SCO65048.1 Plasmodium exported protein, unknown function [Plasmodium vivax]SCO70539.1 Plasmodium exported protein, unknown function [Plasmodium vivax]
MITAKRYPFEEAFRFLTCAKLSTFVLLIWICHSCDKGYVNQSLNSNDAEIDAPLFPCSSRLLAKYEQGTNLKTVKLNQKTGTNGKKKKVTKKVDYHSGSENNSHVDYDVDSDKQSVRSDRKSESSGEPDLLCGQIFSCLDKRASCCSFESISSRDFCKKCPKRKCSKKSPIYYIILGLLLILGVISAIPAMVAGGVSTSWYPLSIILIKLFSLGIVFILIKKAKRK